MKYKMITSDRVKFDLTEEERNAVNKALVAGQKFVIIQGCTISLAIAPTILPFETWIENENERLVTSGKRLCKKCYKIMDVETGCVCWNKNERGEEQPLLGEAAAEFVRNNSKLLN